MRMFDSLSVCKHCHEKINFAVKFFYRFHIVLFVVHKVETSIEM